MMAKRELDLVPRVEAVRDEKKIQPPVHFSLAEILQHYSESYAAVRNQFVPLSHNSCDRRSSIVEDQEHATKDSWNLSIL